MRHQRKLAAKVHEAAQSVLLLRRSGKVTVTYAGKLNYLAREGAVGVNKGLKMLLRLAARKAHRAYFRDAVVFGVKPRSLDIEGDKILGKRAVFYIAVNGELVVNVVDVIALNAEYDLKLRLVLLAGGIHLFRCVPHFGKRLSYAVVCYGKGGMPP